MSWQGTLAWFLCLQGTVCAQWQRVLFENRATEPVLITIDDEGITPRIYHAMLPGEREWLFPRMPLADRPLYIRLSGSSLRQELKLEIEGGVADAIMLPHSCRTYGELVLKRVDDEVARTAAPDNDGMISLVYTADFDLVFGEGMGPRTKRRFSSGSRLYRGTCYMRHCPRLSPERRFKRCHMRQC